MADTQLADIVRHANSFQDRKVVELAFAAKEQFYQQGDLDRAADATRLLVSAKCALLEDAVEVARAGLSMCQPNARGRQLGTQRAEAKMLQALAEAVHGTHGADEQVSEAIEAAERAHNYFASKSDERLRVEACAVLTHLRLSRGEGKDLDLARKSAVLATEVASAMDSRSQGIAFLARAAAFPNDWQPHAEKALELAVDLVDVSLEVEVRLSMARWWARMQEHESSLLQAQDALDVLQEHGAGCHRQIPATQLACKALMELSTAGKGDSKPEFAKALRLSQELLRLADMDSSDVVRILAARHLMETQIACAQASKAIETGKETMKWCQQMRPSSDVYCEGQILQIILRVYGQIKPPDASQRAEMEQMCHKSVAIVQELAQSETGHDQAVELMTQVLKSFTLLGKPLEALTIASQLRQLVRSTVQAPLVLAIAAAMYEAAQLEQSCSLGQEAARLFEDQCDERQAACALSLVAKAQLKMGKYSASRQNGRRARRRFGEIGDCEGEIRMRMVVAKACAARDERGNKQLKDSVREAQEATKLAVDLGNQDLLVESLSTYVEVLFDADHLETCCQVADELLRLEVPAPVERQLSSLMYAAKAQEKLSNFSAAKTYAEKVTELAAVPAGRFTAVLQESREMVAKLRKKCLFDHSTAPLLSQSRWQQEENISKSEDSSFKVKCPRCGYESAGKCISCKAHLPWSGCKFCPECGAKQPQTSNETSAAPSKSRQPAVKAGFLVAKVREENAPLKMRIQELTSKLLGLASEDVEGDIPLKDIGLSSGAAVILRDELQNDVKGIRLPPTLFFDYPTVHAVVGYVTGNLR